MIKAVIFDLDGTLLDTRQDLASAMNLTLKALNKPELSKEDVISYVGHGIRNLVETCIKPNNADEFEEGYKIFQSKYAEEYMKTTIPYNGMKELVKDLNTINIKIGVNSNKDDTYTKNLIKKHFSDIDLEYVVGKREGINIKPSIDGVEYILKKMDVKKEEVIYVGDSSVDIETANNANIDSLSCAWGFKGRKELEKYSETKIVEEPKEILEYVKEK